MNDLELIFNMLGKVFTVKITRDRDVFGFGDNKNAAREGGTVAGVARKELELRSGEKVATHENYFNESKTKKKGLMVRRNRPARLQTL